MAGARRRKIHLYGGAGISLLGKVGLTHTADAHCTLEGREEIQMDTEQFYPEIFHLALNMNFLVLLKIFP